MAYKLSEGTRVAKYDTEGVSAVSGAPLDLGQIEVSPNEAFTFLVSTSANFTLRLVECDKEDGLEFFKNDIAVTAADGYSGELVPAGNLVKVQAFVASGSANIKVRLFKKGVI